MPSQGIEPNTPADAEETKPLIIIAEDDKFVREVAVAKLDRHFNGKYRTLVAHTGEEAISLIDKEMAARSDIFAVLTDHRMPPGQLTGLDVITHTKTKLPYTFIGMWSGTLSKELLNEAYEKGAGVVFSKPDISPFTNCLIMHEQDRVLG